MIEISCRGVLFDLDGVLIDSTPAVTRVWRKWAVQHGFDPDEVVRHAHGRPSLSTIRDYLPNSDHELENRKVEQAEIEDLDGVVALPGARELLKNLPPDCWTIVTSCTRPLAEVRIRAAQLGVPDKIVTCSDVVNGKPDPEPYRTGAALLRIPPIDCVVVEDAPTGIRAGKAAQARVIALRTTAGDDELRHAGADWIVDSCQAIGVYRVSGRGFTLILGNDSKPT